MVNFLPLIRSIFTFYMFNSSFYVVNFLPLIRSIFAFYMVNSTSYMVNFYFFYGQVDFLCGQLFTFFIG